MSHLVEGRNTQHEDSKTILTKAPVLHNLGLPPNIHHHQCCDTLQPAYNPYEVLYIAHDGVFLYNTLKKESVRVLPLSFFATALTVWKHWIAVGDYCNLVVYNLKTKKMYQVKQYSLSVNSLAIYDHYGQPRLLVASNSYALLVYALEGLEKVDTITFSTCVNGVSVNPTSTQFACVGDDKWVYIYDIRQETYYLSSKLDVGGKNNTGCSQEVAWDRFGESFAVANEYPIGQCLVFDPASSSMLAKLPTPLSRPGGAHGDFPCRCAKFNQQMLSNQSPDLLIFTTNASYYAGTSKSTVSLVSISPPPSSSPSQHPQFNVEKVIQLPHNKLASGACFSRDCSRIFVGVEGTGILEIEFAWNKSLVTLCTEYIINHLNQYWKDYDWLHAPLPSEVLDPILEALEHT